MLRTILGQGRRKIQRSQQIASDDHRSEDSVEDSATMQDDEDELEPWVDWIRRVTHSVEHKMEKLKIKPWIGQARKRKWKFAAEISFIVFTSAFGSLFSCCQSNEFWKRKKESKSIRNEWKFVYYIGRRVCTLRKPYT